MNKKHFLTKLTAFSLFSSSLLSANIANAEVSAEITNLQNLNSEKAELSQNWISTGSDTGADINLSLQERNDLLEEIEYEYEIDDSNNIRNQPPKLSIFLKYKF